MNYLISKVKDQNNLLSVVMSLIYSFLLCITIFADRTIPITGIVTLFHALNGNNILTLIFFMFAFLVLKKHYPFFNINNKNNFLFTVFISICFAVCETAGYNIDNYTKLFYPYLNFYTLIFNVLIFCGYFIIFYLVTNLLIKYIFFFTDKISSDDKEFKYFSNNIKSLFFVSGILILFWSIYYFIFFPAVVTWDSYYQITQGLGFRNLTDENPFVHTLFQGFIINIGSKLLGSINLGISIFCIIQMIFISLTVSFVLKTMAKYSVPLLYRIITFLFYLLNPLIGIYSVTLWKDIWISSFLLIYAAILIEMCINTSEFFKSKAKIFSLVLIILFVMLSKGTGIIFIIFSLIPLLFQLSRKYLFKLSTAYLTPFIIFFLIRLIVIPYFDIEKGHVREPLSVPLQQIARTVKENNENISEGEKSEINEILPYDKLSELYNPRLSDNVKGELNEKVFSQNPSKYVKLWIKLGFKYPKSYLESFLSNSYGYWYPETKYWAVSDCTYIKMLNFYKENNWTTYDENIDNYPQEHALIRNTVCDLINDLIREVPAVSMFFSIAFYFWIEFFLIMFCLKNKRYEMLPLFSIIISTFIICIMSPVHAEMRYAYPVIIIFPIIFSFSMFKAREKDAIKNAKQISHN